MIKFIGRQFSIRNQKLKYFIENLKICSCQSNKEQPDPDNFSSDSVKKTEKEEEDKECSKN